MLFEIDKRIRGIVKYNEPMARHTSWRVGGPAKIFFKPADLDDLLLFLQTQPEIDNIVYLGLGSNVLIRDGGINGIVIAMQGVNQQLKKVSANSIKVDAGVSCAKTARFCLQHNMVDAAFLAGIPGTMGGALAMNAGAFGGETWDYVTKVTVLNRQGVLQEKLKSEFKVAYRHISAINHSSLLWFVSAEMQFELANNSAQRDQQIKQLLQKRNTSQPIGLASCGSVFINPEGDYAARLIEQCGLKGKSIGNACISEKHANFIINQGGASAADIESLMSEIQRTVNEKFGIKLVPEVRIIGESLS